MINFTQDGRAVSYDFVNEIETYEGAEVFDFDLRASTKQVLDEHLFLQRRLRRKVFALIHNRNAPSWK